MKRVMIILTLLLFVCGCDSEAILPKPEVTEGVRGELGIDKNINMYKLYDFTCKLSENLVKYLHRVFADLTKYPKKANIGGNLYEYLHN